MNLLTDQLLRVCLEGGDVSRLSLPQLYAAMVDDCVIAFPALRPHQRHAWHAFLAQLGVIAIHRYGTREVPATSDAWVKLLRIPAKMNAQSEGK